MQSLISANQKSITETKMVESSNGYVPFYANEASFPELGIQYQKISPFITALKPANNSITFKLPSGAGLLYEASLRFVMTHLAAAGTDVNSPVGINVIRSIEWLSNGQPVVYKTGTAIWAQITKWTNIEFQQFVFTNAKRLVPSTEEVAVATDLTYATYCPLHDSFLTEAEKALLLNRITDLQLRVTFNSREESGLLTEIDSFVPLLCVQTFMPKLSVYNEMVANDWSKRLVMQSINTYTEVAPLDTAAAVDGVQTTKYTLTTPFLVFKTHIFIRSVVPKATEGGLEVTGINDVTMNLNGQTFLDKMPTSRLESCAAKNGTSVKALGIYMAANVVKYGPKIATIDWGVLCNRGQNSGTAFFQELQGTNITVTYPTLAGAEGTNRLYVVHETFQTIAYEPSSGGGVLMTDSNN